MSILLDEALQDAIIEVAEYGQENVGNVDLRDLLRAKAAEEIIREFYFEVLSVHDIARQLGINVRSLQIAFKQVYDCSMRDMIAQVRLEHARRKLLAGNVVDQVGTIAWECGFTHLSRFAQVYRETYGETPRETLIQSRQGKGR